MAKAPIMRSGVAVPASVAGRAATAQVNGVARRLVAGRASGDTTEGKEMPAGEWHWGDGDVMLWGDGDTITYE